MKLNPATFLGTTHLKTTKIIWYNIFHMYWSNGMKKTRQLIRFFDPLSQLMGWVAPELGFILSISFIFSDLSIWYRLFESTCSLTANPKVLFVRRLLSLSSLSLHFLALTQFYLPAICDPTQKASIMSLVVGGSSLCWLGNYSTAINLALEGDFNYFKIKMLSDSINIVYENWVIKRESFLIPIRFANFLFKYNRRFVLKPLEKRYLFEIVNRIRIFESVRNAYAFKNPFAIVDIRDYKTVLVTVLQLSNGKHLLLAGTSAQVITNIFLIGDRAGSMIASVTKYIP